MVFVLLLMFSFPSSLFLSSSSWLQFHERFALVYSPCKHFYFKWTIKSNSKNFFSAFSWSPGTSRTFRLDVTLGTLYTTKKNLVRERFYNISGTNKSYTDKKWSHFCYKISQLLPRNTEQIRKNKDSMHDVITNWKPAVTLCSLCLVTNFFLSPSLE